MGPTDLPTRGSTGKVRRWAPRLALAGKVRRWVPRLALAGKVRPWVRRLAPAAKVRPWVHRLAVVAAIRGLRSRCEGVDRAGLRMRLPGAGDGAVSGRPP